MRTNTDVPVTEAMIRSSVLLGGRRQRTTGHFTKWKGLPAEICSRLKLLLQRFGDTDASE